MGVVFHCLLAANVILLDPVLPPPSQASQASRDELLVGLPAVDRRGLGLVRFLRTLTLSEEECRRVEMNIVSLGSDDFRRRDRAMRELLTENVGAVILLRKAARDDDLERKRRADLCLAVLERRRHPGRTEAALRLLAVRRPPGARSAILAILPYAADDDLLDQALSTLADLGPLDQADTHACEQALGSVSPCTRGGAALLLGFQGQPAQKSRARKLLDDADAETRLLAAYGLAADRADRDALARLVDLLGQPGFIGGKAERLLASLAGDSAPLTTGFTDEARRQAQTAWRSWLATLEQRPSLARLNLVQELSPSCRAQTVARRFLDVIATRRTSELKKLTGVPFLISGLASFRTHEDLERVFLEPGIKQPKQPRRVRVEMPYVFRGEEYLLQAPEEERTFLNEMSPNQFRAVLIETIDEGQRDRGVLLLRVHENQMHVIGFGRMAGNN